MIYPYQGIWPKIHETAFVAPSVDLIGDVKIDSDSSLWFQIVARADVHWIRIGKRTNIQDQCVLHVTRKSHPLKIGNDVTIGHRVMLHGCTIEDYVLIGMGSILMDGAVIEKNVLIGAGTLVPPGMKIPSGVLALGAPAQVVRDLKKEEIQFLRESAQNYVQTSMQYRKFLRGPMRFGDGQERLEDLDF